MTRFLTYYHHQFELRKVSENGKKSAQNFVKRHEIKEKGTHQRKTKAREAGTGRRETR